MKNNINTLGERWIKIKDPKYTKFYFKLF